MTMAGKSSSVAFGLKAIALAMKAKCNRASLREAKELLESAAINVPDDIEAQSAAAAFAAAFQIDQAVAGVHLHDFLIDWQDGQMAATTRRTEDRLRDMSPAHFDPTHFDWQDRKDCGHE